jgi:hypothetical protein
MWKKRFRSFGLIQEWAPTLSSDGAAFSQQQVDMYSTLIFALPEDDLSIIENVSEDDKTCGHTAWTALVNNYEDDGIYRCTELLQNLDTLQADGESDIQYLNHLVRLQRQLARVGDVVHDRRIIMYLVKGMRSEYHFITGTWDVHNLSMDAVKRDLHQKDMRIESRAQSRKMEPSTPLVVTFARAPSLVVCVVLPNVLFIIATLQSWLTVYIIVRCISRYVAAMSFIATPRTATMEFIYIRSCYTNVLVVVVSRQILAVSGQ